MAYGDQADQVEAALRAATHPVTPGELAERLPLTALQVRNALETMRHSNWLWRRVEDLNLRHPVEGASG